MPPFDELARARVLVSLLDPVDPYRLGLYAVLRVLCQEARARDQWSSAFVVERGASEHPVVAQRSNASEYALQVRGVVLGLHGEEGWDEIMQRLATEKGWAQCFADNRCCVIQHPHAELNWAGAEEEEVEAEICQRQKALEAALQAHELGQATVQAQSGTLRRGL